jgi:hypothetical protein
MNKYLTTLVLAFALISGAGIASENHLMSNKLDTLNKSNVSMNSVQSNDDSVLDDSFKDEVRKKRLLDNKDKMKLNLKLADKRLGLDKEQNESRKK